MKKYTLLDAVKRHEEFPDTFQIPAPEEFRDAQVGNFVKIGLQFTERGHVEVERIWVKVTKKAERTGDYVFTGTIDNDPMFTRSHGVVCGDEVTIRPKHVLCIIT